MKPIFVARGSEQLGQFSEEEVLEGLSSGRFLTSDLWWKEGMEEWQPLSSFRLRTAASLPVPQQSSEPQQAALQPANSFPWEQQGTGVVKRWWETTVGCLFSPITTFREMPVTGGYGSPLVYGILAALVGGLGMGITQAVLQVLIGVFGAGENAEAAAAGGIALLCGIPITILSSMVGGVVGVIIGAFIGGGIMHLFLMIFGAAARGYEATVRAFCYSTGAINALYLVPVLGWLAAMVWGPVVYVISLKEAHQTEYWKVICAILLYLLICCGAIAGLAVAFGGVIAAMAGSELSTTP